MVHKIRYVGLLVAVLTTVPSNTIAQSTGPAQQSATTRSTTTQPVSETLEELVTQLESTDWSVRRRSQEKLIALGATIIPDLQEISRRQTLSAEAHKAIEVVLGRLQNQIEYKKTLVTLKLESAEPASAFAALAKQGQLSFDEQSTELLARKHEKTLSNIDIKEAPFWDALYTLSGQAGVAFSGVNRDGTLRLIDLPEGATRAPSAIAGPFLLSLSRIELNLSKSTDFVGRAPQNVRTNRFAAPPCRLYLYASGEPRLKPIHWFVDAVTGVGDHGRVLSTVRRGASITSGQVNTSNETQLLLDGSFEGAKEISKLQISARIMLERKHDTLEIENVLSVKDKTYEVGGFRLLWKGINQLVGDQYAYSFVVYRDNKSPQDWENLRALIGDFGCKILDSEGHSLGGVGGNQSISMDEIKTTNTLTRSAGKGVTVGEPAKLVWDFPSEVQEVKVPFVFTDIPLPK